MVDPEILITRITARRTCETCNTIVNLSLDPTNTFSRCPTCGGNLVHREDDNEVVVRRRIEAYHEETEPLLEYYQSRDILHKVGGIGTVSEVRMRIADILQKLGARSVAHDQISEQQQFHCAADAPPPTSEGEYVEP
jgi:adenylate kinase